jgi:hypothetical protein
MLKLMNRIWGITRLAMDEAGGDGGGGGTGGEGSLLNPSGDGGGTSSGQGAGAAGNPPNSGGGGSGGGGTGTAPEGNGTADWRSALPKEFQENASLKRYKSVADLAGAYINAEKLISGDKVPVPNKNWTEHDWKNFFTKVGLPESVDKYEVKFKDGVTIDEQFSKQFIEHAHKAGILPRQAQALADWFSDVTAQSEQSFIKEREAQFKQGVQELRQEWGNAFDLRVAQANKLIQEIGAHKHFQEMGYGSDVKLMKMLAEYAAKIYTDPKIFEGGGVGGNVRTPAEIDAAIGQLMVSDAYQSADHPGHKAAVEEMAALHQEKVAARKS